MDISTGVSSYFNNIPFENWGFIDLLKYLSRKCVGLTSENRDEIFEEYKSQLRSIIASKLMLKIAKDKARKLKSSAESTFQHQEVTLFFKKLDTEAMTNATKNLTNAIRDFVNESENLDESNLEARVITRRIEDINPEVGCSYNRIRTSEDDDENIMSNRPINLQFNTSTVPEEYDDKVGEQESEDHDNCEEKAIEEELHSYDFCPTPLTNVLSQQTISLLSILKNYCAKPNTSPYDLAHSFILDLSPKSKIRNEFSYEQWSELSKRPEVANKTFHQEIEPFIAHLFENNISLSQARLKWYELRNVAAPTCNDKFSYNENDWEKIKLWIERAIGQFLNAFESNRNPLQDNCYERQWTGDFIVPLIQGALQLDGRCHVPWGDVTVLATQRRRNDGKDIYTERVSRSHQADLLCKFEQNEIACGLISGRPRSHDLTKYASDQFNLPRMMKDMLDDLELKFYYSSDHKLYIIGIQVYMTEVQVYMIEKREVCFLHHLKSFDLPISFSSYNNLKLALRTIWNIRGLVNSLIQEFNIISDDNDGFKTPPQHASNDTKT